MQADDMIFWDRIHDMPPVEAEQECVLRRENNSLQIAMLQREHAGVIDRRGAKCQEARDIGVAIAEVGAQNTALNERIKYLRKLQDKLQWKEAVRTLFGDEACEQCVVWIQQTYMARVAGDQTSST